MEAFIFVNTEPGLFWTVAEEAERIQGVLNADAVTGEFDVIVHAEYAGMNDLGEITVKLRSLNGVVKTQTLIAMPVTSNDLGDEPHL